MLYYYALLPDVFRPELLSKCPSNQIIVKELLRGINENGLIADLHESAWSKHIETELLPQIPPQLEKQITDCLSILKKRNRLITCAPYSKGKPACYEEWLDVALAAHSQHELHGIVLTQALMQQYGSPHPAFVELSDILDSAQWRERTHDITVSRSRHHYKAALTPLLKYARTIDLIDPYLNCQKKRFLDVVLDCAHLLGKGRHRPELSRIISIHAGDPQENKYGNEAPVERLRAWEEILRPLVNVDPNLRFRVYLWSEYGRPERLHDRCIMTDQCCVEIPGGLDTGKGTTTWTLKSEKLHRQVIARFNRATTPYHLIDKVEITK